jgi:phosphoribosyl-ATP pyrophosphohydrolase
MSYHIAKIKKGVLGKASKIQEELDELVDAENQNNKIMAMVELSDIYGALRLVAKEYGVTMDDLQVMADATERAFKNGHRK